jgi:hypothetical protein
VHIILLKGLVKIIKSMCPGNGAAPIPVSS